MCRKIRPGPPCGRQRARQGARNSEELQCRQGHDFEATRVTKMKYHNDIVTYLYAEAYWIAAEHLAAEVEAHRIRLRFPGPVHHLYSHAIETVLKAFLQTRGYTTECLAKRQWGHNLEALYGECIKKGLRLGRNGWAERKRLIALINTHHSAPYSFRYLQVGATRVPTAKAFSGLCKALFHTIRPLVGARPHRNLPTRGQVS